MKSTLIYVFGMRRFIFLPIEKFDVTDQFQQDFFLYLDVFNLFEKSVT